MNPNLLLLLSLSLSGTILILVLFALRPLWKNRLSKSWQYFIWLIVIARLLLPFGPEANLTERMIESVSSWSTMTAVPEQTPPSHVPPAQTPPIQTPPVAAPDHAPVRLDGSGNGDDLSGSPESRQTPADQTAISLLPINADRLILLGWACVASVLLLRKAAGYLRFSRAVRRDAVPVEDPALLDRYAGICSIMYVKRRPRLYINVNTASPMLVGMFRPAILLPDAEALAPGMEGVLCHELTHYRRKDLFYKWLLQITLCLHWFNPAVWLMVRAVEQDCELACDEAVLRRLGYETRKSYGDMLLASISLQGKLRNPSGTLSLTEEGKQIKERLISIMKPQTNTKMKRVISIALALSLCMFSVLLGSCGNLSVPSGKAPQNSSAANGTDLSTPDGTLNYTLGALKEMDLDTFNTYSDNLSQTDSQTGIQSKTYNGVSQYSLFHPASGDVEQELLAAITDQLTWSLDAPQISGDTATVTIHLTNLDLTDLVVDYTLDILHSPSMWIPVDPDRYITKLAELVEDSDQTVTLEVTATLNKTDGKWILHLNDELVNAICGNMFAGIESGEVDAALDQAVNEISTDIEDSMDHLLKKLGLE